MSLLSNLFRPAAAAAPQQPERRASLENPAVSINDADAWYDAFGMGGPSLSGEDVTTTTALSLSAFWACVKMISGDTSRLPLRPFETPKPDAKAKPDHGHYLNGIISPLGKANAELPALKLWRRVMTHATIYEQGFVWCEWKTDRQTKRPRLVGLHQLLSDRTAMVKKRGRLWCVTEVGEGNKAKIVARPADEVLHIEGLCIDGLGGCQLVAQAREDIGNALASRNFKSQFFAHGMHAGGILQAPEGAGPAAIRKVEDAIQEHTSVDRKAFRTLVLRDQFKWHSTQVNPGDAQLTEIDEAGVRDLARRFLLSPARLGVKESVSYNSLEQERRDYHDTTLGYWLSMIAAEASTKLLSDEERAAGGFIDYDVNLALLWADAATLATIGAQGVNARDQYGRPIFEADEVRAWFRLPARDEDGPPELPAPAPPAAPPVDPPAGDTNGPDDETRAAIRDVLTQEIGRVLRRFEQHAERAERRGALGRAAFLQMLPESTHAEVAREALQPAARAAAACGLLERSGRDIADAVLSAYVHDQKTTAEQLAAVFIPDR